VRELIAARWLAAAEVCRAEVEAFLDDMVPHGAVALDPA